MLSYKIAKINDMGIVRQLASEIFPQTYKDILSPIQLEYMFEMMYSLENLEKQFETQILTIIYDGNKPVGYLAVEQLEQNRYIFQKIYLLPNLQGKGLGRYIIEVGTALCTKISNNENIVIELFVNRQNKAVEFYKHIGFKITEERDFHIGNNYYMNDYIMELKINNNENNLL